MRADLFPGSSKALKLASQPEHGRGRRGGQPRLGTGMSAGVAQRATSLSAAAGVTFGSTEPGRASGSRFPWSSPSVDALGCGLQVLVEVDAWESCCVAGVTGFVASRAAFASALPSPQLGGSPPWTVVCQCDGLRLIAGWALRGATAMEWADVRQSRRKERSADVGQRSSCAEVPTSSEYRQEV